MKYIMIIIAALALLALLTRDPLARWAFRIIFGLILVYVVLKLTGVIDAIHPSRIGVF